MIGTLVSSNLYWNICSGNNSLVWIGTTCNKGVFVKRLGSIGHIHGMFHIFDDYYWNISSTYKMIILLPYVYGYVS